MDKKKLQSATRRRQDDARDLGRAAGRSGASKRLKDHLKRKHCLTQDEIDEFEKGVKEGQEQ